MNLPGFSAAASFDPSRSYRSSGRGRGLPASVVTQAPPGPGTGTTPPGGPAPPWPPYSWPCEAWKLCTKYAKSKSGFVDQANVQANCNRLYSLAKCINDESPMANCVAVAESNTTGSPPPFPCHY
jgi:hypothetical protein